MARATQSLSRFNLDFGGASVGSVKVNHRRAAWTRDGEQLVITPKRALSRRRVFVVVVSDFVAVPTEPDPTGYADFDDLIRAIYAHGDEWRAAFGPVAQPTSAEALFSFQSYHGGALVLYESIGTADFIELASKVARRDLSDFLEEWLYGTTTPPMPGHPDWTVNPVEESAEALRAPGGGRAGRPTP